MYIVRNVVAVAIAATATVYAQTFDVVSIKRNTSGALGSNGSSERPDGSVTLLNIPITTLIARGYPANMPIPVSRLTGLPGWAGVTGERYDIVAKSSLSRPATADERQGLVRALLADRFKFVAHLEKREQQTYDLMFARPDHRLGPNITPSEPACAAKVAAEIAAMEAAHAAGKPLTPPPLDLDNPSACRRWTMGIPAAGDITIDMLTNTVQLAAQRPITNKTGLTGSYRIALTFDFGAVLRGPEVAPNPDAPPSVFVALQEQLGFKLEPVTIAKDTLVIDRIERPTEN